MKKSITKKSVILISSILLVAFIAGSAFAWGPGSGKRMSSSERGKNCNIINNLSQDKKDKLTALRQQFIDETYELRSAKFTKQQEMKMLMEISDPDRAKLGKLSQEITTLQGQIRDKQIDFRLSAKKIAPELVRGAGFGQNCNKCGQKRFHGQKQGNSHRGNRSQNN